MLHGDTNEDFIMIGPNKSKDILSDTSSLISKAYCLIYNIMQRCTHAKDHDTYILDEYPRIQATSL